jgi:hypothetical protein
VGGTLWESSCVRDAMANLMLEAVRNTPATWPAERAVRSVNLTAPAPIAPVASSRSRCGSYRERASFCAKVFARPLRPTPEKGKARWSFCRRRSREWVPPPSAQRRPLPKGAAPSSKSSRERVTNRRTSPVLTTISCSRCIAGAVE